MGSRPAGDEDRGFALPGTAVEVRNRFDGCWSQGFEVAELVTTGTGTAFRLRRTSDRSVLPVLFRADEVFVVR